MKVHHANTRYRYKYVLIIIHVQNYKLQNHQKCARNNRRLLPILVTKSYSVFRNFGTIVYK